MTKPMRIRRISRKNKRQERSPALTPHQPDRAAGSAEPSGHETLHVHTPHRQAEQLQEMRISSLQRQAMALEIARAQGNRQLAAMMQTEMTGRAHAASTLVQAQNRTRPTAAHPGGCGPGVIQSVQEVPYAVKGKHLQDLLPQLERFNGFAAETQTATQYTFQPPQQQNGRWTTRITWEITNVTVHLPRWVDYDIASPAAQQEWDRYMQRTRQHEEERHFKAVKHYLQTRPKVSAATTATALEAAIQQANTRVNEHIQTKIHNQCGHGVEIDAIRHVERDPAQ